MALEDLTGSSKFIDDLVATNPTVLTDKKFQGDDHIRGIKNVLLNTFPSITGAITATQAELNVLDGILAVVGDLNLIEGMAAGGGQVLTGDNNGTTKSLFMQAAAPYGWTVDSAWDDRVLTLDSAAGGTTGGVLDLTTGTLTTSTVGTHTHSFSASGNTSTATGSASYQGGGHFPAISDHSHSFSTSGTTGADGSHSHTVDAPAWAKAIVCTLDTL